MPYWMTLPLVTDLTSSCAGEPAFLHSGHPWVDSHYWSKSVCFYSYNYRHVSKAVYYQQYKKQPSNIPDASISSTSTFSLKRKSHVGKKVILSLESERKMLIICFRCVVLRLWWIDESISVMGIYVKWVAIQGGWSQATTILAWHLGGACHCLCHYGCCFACVLI